MFEFKILQAPDRTQLGTYEHANNELVVGNSEGDMVIDDPHIGSMQLKLFFQGMQAFCQNVNPGIEVKLNNVVMSTQAMPVKARDTLAMGKTLITFLKIKLGPLEPPQLDDSSKARTYDELPENTPERVILQALGALAAQVVPPPVGDAAVPPPLPSAAPPPLPKPPIPTKT